MKLLSTLGRPLAALFWLALLAHLVVPFAKPFATLLELLAAVVLAWHLLLLALCHGRLRSSPRATRDRLGLLAFGVFYLDALPAPEAVVEQLLQASREAEPSGESSDEVAPASEPPLAGDEAEPAGALAEAEAVPEVDPEAAAPASEPPSPSVASLATANANGSPV